MNGDLLLVGIGFFVFGTAIIYVYRWHLMSFTWGQAATITGLLAIAASIGLL